MLAITATAVRNRKVSSATPIIKRRRMNENELERDLVKRRELARRLMASPCSHHLIVGPPVWVISKNDRISLRDSRKFVDICDCGQYHKTAQVGTTKSCGAKLRKPDSGPNDRSPNDRTI